MHRSGTSLTTNWLNQCGLHIGENLLGGGRSNQLGHFEDIDFLYFHKNVLKENGLNWELDQQKIQFDAESIQEAKRLVAKKSVQDQWGWKDPRNCLFLELWNDLIEQPFYLVVFRNHKDVIASLLLRRKKDLINENGQLLMRPIRYLQYYLSKKKLIKSYARSWLRYNGDVLKFLKNEAPKNVLMTNINTLQEKDALIIDQLNNFGFSLNLKPVQEVFEERLMNKKLDIKLPIQLDQQCRQVWEELVNQEKELDNKKF